MKYYYSHYDTGELYIEAYDEDEPYADVTICLAQYGIIPENNQIVIPFDKMKEEDYQTYLKDLVKFPIRTVRYGPFGAIGVLAELREDWMDICIPFE